MQYHSTTGRPRNVTEIKLEKINFPLFVKLQLKSVMKSGASVDLGILENGKFRPSEKGEHWNSIKATWTHKTSVRTIQSFRDEYNELYPSVEYVEKIN